MSARATYTLSTTAIRLRSTWVSTVRSSSPRRTVGVFFPAVSVGWTLSEEKFFKDNIDRKWIDFFKIRASYGIVGNDRLGESRFLYLDDVRVAYNQGWVTDGTVPFVAGTRQLRRHLAAGQSRSEMGKGTAAELRSRH